MNFLFATYKNPFGPGPYGGAESSTRLLAERMSSRGHKVLYLTSSGSQSDKDLAAAVGVNLYFLPSVDWNKYRVRGRLKRRLERFVKTLTIGALVRKHKVDIIYTFYELNILEAALNVRRWLAKPKIIMRMAGLKWYVDSLKSPSRKERYERVFELVDSVNYIEEGLVPLVEAKLEEMKLPRTFNHSFVQDIGSSTPAKRDTCYRNIPARPFRILMAARFSDYQKRQDLLVEAIARMPRSLEVEATLVGEGIRREEICALAEELGAADRVKILDFLEQGGLWRLMEKTHLLCHATDFEGLGKSVVEAMHKGLPVLVSDVQPLNSYIRHGENGFLVENDPSAWAASIETLANSPDILAKVSEDSLAYVQQKWDPEVCAEAYEARFAEVARL